MIHLRVVYMRLNIKIDTNWLEVKGWKNIQHVNSDQQLAGVAY